MGTEATITAPAAASIPNPITPEWINDLRGRVLRNDPMVTREELRAAREHIRVQHLAAGMITRGKAKDTAIATEAIVGNTALDNW